MKKPENRLLGCRDQIEVLLQDRQSVLQPELLLSELLLGRLLLQSLRLDYVVLRAVLHMLQFLVRQVDLLRLRRLQQIPLLLSGKTI